MKKLLPAIFFAGSLLFLLRALFLGGYPDFNAYYYGSIDHNIPNYPPFVAILFSIFSCMPLNIAGILWVILSVFFLLTSLYLVFKLFNIKFFSPIALFLSSLVFISFPVKFTLGMGQLNLLVLLLIVLILYFYIKGKDSYAGVFLGTSIMLKLFPILLLLYFFLFKKYKILLYAIAVFLGLGGISYLIIKPEINNYYWQNLPNILNSTPEAYYNQALSGFLRRQFNNQLLAELLRIIISLFFIIFSILLIIKKGIGNFSKKTLGFGLIILLNVLINGHSWQHHFVWLILTFLIVFFYININKLSPKNYIFLGISYVLVSSNIRYPNLISTILQSHVFFGSLLLWMIMVCYLFKND
jgi:alpha-1,2-mannosyltransferase